MNILFNSCLGIVRLVTPLLTGVWITCTRYPGAGTPYTRYQLAHLCIFKLIQRKMELRYIHVFIITNFPRKKPLENAFIRKV